MIAFPKSFIRNSISILLGLSTALVGYIYLEQADPTQQTTVAAGKNVVTMFDKTWTFHYIIIPCIGVFILILLLLIAYNLPLIPALVRQFTNAKIYGLWENNYLDSQVTDSFNKSKEIKVKVTRGYNLFCKENENFYKSLSDNNLNTFKENEGQRMMKVLLHFPCLESEHIQERSEANDIHESNYIKTLHETIEKLLTVGRKHEDKLLIKIRLYGDRQYKWRFYIFQKNREKVLFLNHYDDRRPGAESPMLKIFNDATLCDDFDEAFEDIFKNHSYSIRDFLKRDYESKRKYLGCQNESLKCINCINTFCDKIENLKTQGHKFHE